MKKSLISIVFVVTLVCILVSCSAKDIGSGDISTTDITDINGKTHYYETVTDQSGEPVTDNKGNSVYSEIVTDKFNNYVTNENTTVFGDKVKEKDIYESETNKTNSADNEVTFNHPDESTTQKSTTNITNTTESTTQKETTTQSVTDKDGWINKWY